MLLGCLEINSGTRPSRVSNGMSFLLNIHKKYGFLLKKLRFVYYLNLRHLVSIDNILKSLDVNIYNFRF